MIAKAEAHKEIEQVQQEIEDDRRHVIQVCFQYFQMVTPFIFRRP